MSIEAPVISLPDKPLDRRSELYSRIDAKAEVLADLRDKIEGLGSPLWIDSPEAVYLENVQLRSVVNRLSSLLPDSYRAYQLQESLIDQFDIENGEVSSDDWDGVEEKLEELKSKNPDIKFVGFVMKGVEGLINRRNRIREFQIKWGVPDLKGEYTSDLQRFEDLREVIDCKMPEGVGRYITKVQLSRFSVNVFLSDQIYDNATKGIHELPSLGFQLGLVNFIRDPGLVEPDDLDHINSLSRVLISFELQKTMNHEEVHAIVDEFIHDNPSIRYFEKRVEDFLLKQSQDLDDGIIHDDGVEDPDYYLENEDLRGLGDASHEELLAEIFSESSREGIPSATYAEIGKLKTDLFWRTTLSKNKSTSKKSLLVRYPISVRELRERIGEVYRKVQENIPERLKQVDALFIFILPSQFSLIEKTVERWIKEKED